MELIQKKDLPEAIQLAGRILIRCEAGEVELELSESYLKAAVHLLILSLGSQGAPVKLQIELVYPGFQAFPLFAHAVQKGLSRSKFDSRSPLQVSLPQPHLNMFLLWAATSISDTEECEEFIQIALLGKVITGVDQSVRSQPAIVIVFRWKVVDHLAPVYSLPYKCVVRKLIELAP